MKERDCANCKHHTSDGCTKWDCEFEAKDLISRADAIDAVAKLCVDGYKAKVDGYFIPLTDALINTLSALPSAETVPQSEQYKKGFEDAKRAFELEYARESENMRKRIAQLEVILNAQKAISAEAEEAVLNKMLEEEMIVLPQDYVRVVRCKDCKWYKKIVEKSKSGLCHYDLVARCLHDEDYCSYGKRREDGKE